MREPAFQCLLEINSLLLIFCFFLKDRVQQAIPSIAYKAGRLANSIENAMDGCTYLGM